MRSFLEENGIEQFVVKEVTGAGSIVSPYRAVTIAEPLTDQFAPLSPPEALRHNIVERHA